MPKPWARIEVGYFDHPKFLALSANAICLWHEGKNYCDKYHTDGLIPNDALKRFRFRGVKPVSQLLMSCGPKADGTAYGPLWEEHPVGYRMHDYLDHNPCRVEALAHMAMADAKREKDRERQRQWRESHRVVTPDVTRDTNTKVASTVLEEKRREEKREERTEAPPPRAYAPIHDTSHRKHAHCGRVCLPAPLFGDFVRRRNHAGADQEIREWALQVEREWSTKPDEPGEAYEFWKARYAEKWPTVTAKKNPYDGWKPRGHV